jgi:hypothetical protein
VPAVVIWHTLTGKPQKTGLGRRIVEYFGGNFGAENRPAEEAGFIFTAPLLAPEQ